METGVINHLLKTSNFELHKSLEKSLIPRGLFMTFQERETIGLMVLESMAPNIRTISQKQFGKTQRNATLFKVFSCFTRLEEARDPVWGATF